MASVIAFFVMKNFRLIATIVKLSSQQAGFFFSFFFSLAFLELLGRAASSEHAIVNTVRFLAIVVTLVRLWPFQGI